MTFDDATQEDAADLTALNAAAATDLTTRFGEGHWSRAGIVRRVEGPTKFVRVRVCRERGRVVTSLRLQTKKPWAIDVSYFTPVRRALYLTGLVVDVKQQGSGLGRKALEDAAEVARAWPAEAIRLDAYDAAAGASDFYRRCGYVERGRVSYRGVALVYFERIL